ncbi:hypothetical protein DY000_02052277 [Brassica cretica]|uniref:Uncharacterized protein n=1 Tax=Brassica cretica TaxID=69181 RepID=A0ABQ7ALB5_BRACR|nr:hypothetical protein DY000_02052277 [Brassica cretica]
MFSFSSGLNQISKVKLNDYNKALSGRQPTTRSKKKKVNINNGTVAAPSGTVARKSSDTVARTSTDTVAENWELLQLKRSEEDEFAEGSTMAAQHRSTEHHKYRSPLNCVDRYSHLWQPSTDETMSLSVDSTSSTMIDCHFIVSIDTEQVIVLTC